MHTLPAAFAAMASYPQWIVYKLVPKGDKTDKLPVDWNTGKLPMSGQGGEAIWTTCDNALAAATRFGESYGVGFSFSDNDPFWFLDIDNAALPDGSGWSQIALELCAMLPGAAIEVSQSGRGLHLFGTGILPPHSCKHIALGLELYHTGRFVALTGIGATGNASTDCTAGLAKLVRTYFTPTSASVDVSTEWTTAACPEWRGPVNDTDLIRRAGLTSSTAVAFGNKASFSDLWDANIPALSRAFPSTTPGQAYDASSADSALAARLAFWTGRNCERMAGLMQQSALKREKWEREAYLKATVLNACKLVTSVCVDKEPPAAPIAPIASMGDAPKPTPYTGETWASVEQQIEMFRGCVYVTDRHEALVTGGWMISPEVFKVVYGGFNFIMGADNTKVSKNAWEAFTQNQGFRCPRADTTHFRPDLPPGSIIELNGQRLVNTYYPTPTPRVKGDASPFLDHLAKVLPVPSDREILLAYMAAIIQHPGIKFQWCPLIQGVEGNGKSLFSRCISYAVGERYSYFPSSGQLASNFNDWIYGRIFYGVEDIYVPHSRADILEALKPMITGDRLEIEGKGLKKETRGICGNFILNSNHKDAVKKTANDRRFCVMYSAQQNYTDLARDGMSGDYFPKLYAWLKADGYAIVNDYLASYAIPAALNPATLCHRAPDTTSTEEAVKASHGRVEQEILEAIDQGLPGFSGGWISSMAVDKLLDAARLTGTAPRNKRKELLASLGYYWHPGLPEGRVNNMILPDGGKPRLFINDNHPSAKLIGPAEIARAYTEAQSGQIIEPVKLRAV